MRTPLLIAALAAFTPHCPAADTPIDLIAFGSCAHEERDQPIWETVVAERPDVFLFIGDNVYVDKPEPPRTAGDFADDYWELLDKPGFQRLRRACPIHATWDDHDFGLNDAGREFPLKREAQLAMLSFFREPADSPRWTREGVYGAWDYGPAGKRVQIILLDTRTFRSPLRVNPLGRVRGKGPYLGHESPGPGGEPHTLLGEAQWGWLAQQLARPADVRVIGSSIQVVAEEHGWEAWCNFPAERRRLYDLMTKTGAEGVVFLSGDRHQIEISRAEDGGVPYPIVDFTSSGLNDPDGDPSEPNRYRVTPVLKTSNVGLVRIDWDASPVAIELEGVGLGGKRLVSHRVTLDELRVSGE
ncbi:MAG: alkaline phosphatase D family protein [Planctomycetota bacterium]